MDFDLGDRLGVELENIFDGKGGRVVEFDLVCGGRDNEVVAVGSDIKDIRVAVRECRRLSEVQRRLDKTRLQRDWDGWWCAVVHGFEVGLVCNVISSHGRREK